MKISIVIPNWNGREKLARNLPEVLKVAGVDEVIISDDASTDGSVEMLKKDFPQVKVVIRAINGGFSSNVNTGVKASSGDLFLLLNSDAVPSKDCVEITLKHFEKEEVFSVSCGTGGNWVWAKFKDGFFWHNQSPEKTMQAHETLWASGGSSVFRRDIWDKLGGLDELFDPFYEEDLDIGYRARKRGYVNIFEPAAQVEHYQQKGVIEENFSKERVSLVAQRNQLIFIWKNITSVRLINQHILALMKMLLAHPGYFRVFWSALIRMPQIFSKRQIERKQAKLTDEQILSKFKI